MVAGVPIYSARTQNSDGCAMSHFLARALAEYISGISPYTISILDYGVYQKLLKVYKWVILLNNFM